MPAAAGLLRKPAEGLFVSETPCTGIDVVRRVTQAEDILAEARLESERDHCRHPAILQLGALFGARRLLPAAVLVTLAPRHPFSRAQTT